MHRNQVGRSWIPKATVYALSATLAGLAAGALLGGAGSLLPLEHRLGLASLLAVAAIAVGSLEVFGFSLQPLQRDCETPQRWIYGGALRWATQNGLALGFGATTRIGFWSWYAVPAGALLIGSPELGAIIYGTYGLVRALGAWAIMLGIRKFGFTDISDWLIEHVKTARLLAAGQLVFLGVAVAIAVGL